MNTRPSASGSTTCMALSPDGGTLAVAVDVVPGNQTRQPATGHASIEVVSLRTGARRAWTAPAPTELQNLSWVSGTTLGFSSLPASRYGTTSYQVRTLDTAGPAGDLMSRSRRVPLAATGQADDDTAKSLALDVCQKRADALPQPRKCELYAVGNTMVRHVRPRVAIRTAAFTRPSDQRLPSPESARCW